jgi:hypothetical protein
MKKFGNEAPAEQLGSRLPIQIGSAGALPSHERCQSE